MNKTIINRILTAIVPVLFVLLFVDRCSMTRKYDNTIARIDSLTLANQKLDSIKNKQGETILTQKTIIVENTKTLNNLTDSIFQLKKKDAKNTQTIVYYKSITRTHIDSIGVPYIDTIAMKTWEDSVRKECSDVLEYVDANMITVPRTAILATDNFTIQATVKKDSLVIDHISIPDTLQLRFVEHKSKLFKRGSIEVQFFHSNPNITTTQSNSVFYKPAKKSFFKRVLLPIAIGIGTGILINK